MLSPAQISDLLARTDIRALATRFGARINRRGVGSCPICGGGKSAQRFQIKDASRWVCAVCNEGGDALALAQKKMGLSFPDAVAFLGGAMTLSAEQERKLSRERAAKDAAREREAAKFREAERARLFALWGKAKPFPGSLVEDYLRLRGVSQLDDLSFRFHAEMPFFHGDETDERGRKTPRLIHRGPAMLVPFLDSPGVFRGLHITWIDLTRAKGKALIFDPDNGEVLSAKKMRGSKAGCYLPLSRHGDPARLRIAEGIEKLLAVRQFLNDGATYRCSGDLGNLGGGALETVAHSHLKHANGHVARFAGPQPDPAKPGIPAPDESREIWWFADSTSEREMTDAAMTRAVARHARPGREQKVIFAPDGRDWDDLARESARG